MTGSEGPLPRMSELTFALAFLFHPHGSQFARGLDNLARGIVTGIYIRSRRQSPGGVVIILWGTSFTASMDKGTLRTHKTEGAGRYRKW